MLRIGSDEGKELPQQDTVGGLVPAVLDGQGLQEGEGAAPVAGNVAPPVWRPGLDQRACLAPLPSPARILIPGRWMPTSGSTW